MVQIVKKNFEKTKLIRKYGAHAVIFILIMSFINNIQSAHAMAPTLSSTSNISNGGVDPNIIVKSTNYATDLNKFAFTVDLGTTGLTFDSAAYINSTSVRLNFRGTALAGSITIQASTSAFNPTADSLSNTLTMNVPNPLIDQTITFDNLLPMNVSDLGQILSATSTSGLEVSFSSKTPDTCRIVSLKIIALATGACSVKASQNGNSTYHSALDIIKSITISAAISVVVEKPVSVVSNGTTFATVEYSPDAANNTFRDLVISSRENGQIGATKLKLLVPRGATKSRAAFLVSSYSSDSENEQGFFVVRIGLVDEFQTVLNKLEKVYKINMPRGYLYSEIYWSDLGTMWQRIPETIKESLPTDSHAAFFREVDGSVSVLTDEVGLFGYRFPQEELKVNSPVKNFTLNNQIILGSSGGSGTGALTYGTSTSSVCTVTAQGVVTGKQAGDCFVFVRKYAAEQYIDAVSTKMIVTVRSNAISASGSNQKTIPATPTVASKSESGCNFLSYSLTHSPNQVQANFCPQDAGKVAILYVRSASSTRKWVDKKIGSVVIDSNGAAVFSTTLEISSSNFLHIFVNGEHRL